MSEIFCLIAELAEKHGATPINDKVWTFIVDKNWTFAVNGHKEAKDGVPPFSAMVYFNGFPSGIIGFDGGIIAGGEAANEDAFIESLYKSLAA